MAMNDYSVQIIRSRRKTLGIEIASPGVVLIRAPMRMPLYEIRKTVAGKQGWIEKHLAEGEQS